MRGADRLLAPLDRDIHCTPSLNRDGRTRHDCQARAASKDHVEPARHQYGERLALPPEPIGQSRHGEARALGDTRSGQGMAFAGTQSGDIDDERRRAIRVIVAAEGKGVESRQGARVADEGEMSVTRRRQRRAAVKAQIVGAADETGIEPNRRIHVAQGQRDRRGGVAKRRRRRESSGTFDDAPGMRQRVEYGAERSLSIMDGIAEAGCQLGQSRRRHGWMLPACGCAHVPRTTVKNSTLLAAILLAAAALAARWRAASGATTRWAMASWRSGICSSASNTATSSARRACLPATCPKPGTAPPRLGPSCPAARVTVISPRLKG